MIGGKIVLNFYPYTSKGSSDFMEWVSNFK